MREGDLALAAFGQRVRDLREARGLSRMKLAAAAGVSLSTLLLMEMGRTAPRLDTVFALAEALGVRLVLAEGDA